MSIQAVAWALEQEDIPARPKLVLVSLANHANHVDGYCWLKAETIAKEAACSARGVFNFVGDLIRNGYVRKAPKRGDDGKQRANDYWLLLDRPAAEWVKAGKDEEAEADTDTDEAEPQDVVVPDAAGACRNSVETTVPDPVDIPSGACGPSAPACMRKDSAEPSKTKPSEGEVGGYVPRAYRPPPEPPPQPVGAVVEGVNASARIFAIEGTPAYEAWAKVMAARNRTAKWHLTTSRVVDGRQQRGWYFPTLFPPKAPGADPPSTTNGLTDSDLAYLSK